MSLNPDHASDLQTAEEGDNLRVWAADQSYLLKRIDRERFLEQYRKAWNRLRLNFSPMVTATATIEFTDGERVNLCQRIVMGWLYVYNANNRRLRFLWWSMRDSQTRRNVLEATQSKLGVNSEAAISLAAHTLGMRLSRFRAWMKRDEQFVNMF